MSRNYQIQSFEQDIVTDYSSIRATRRIGRRIAYSVEATLSGASIVSLRGASTDYPEWVDRYLQLPDVSPRVQELASRFATAGDNAFDRAQRIEFFLRRYPFSIEVPEPTPGTDVVDHYLFELRRGYADYTASAMAVLARLNGIPRAHRVRIRLRHFRRGNREIHRGTRRRARLGRDPIPIFRMGHLRTFGVPGAARASGNGAG